MIIYIFFNQRSVGMVTGDDILAGIQECFQGFCKIGRYIGLGKLQLLIKCVIQPLWTYNCISFDLQGVLVSKVLSNWFH